MLGISNFFISTLLALCLSCSLHCSRNSQHEKIEKFLSTIQINNDASLTVTEEISVVALGKQFKHGLLREFPTRYKDSSGGIFEVEFSVKDILLNGQAVQYRTKSVSNGLNIYIGDPKRRLIPGRYTYTICYVTHYQLSNLKQSDQLYWNVTGNGWRLPIDHASARVILPDGVNLDTIKLTAYTGFQGQKGKKFKASKNIQDNTIWFETTNRFLPRQGLTIVVDWPKGFVTHPVRINKFFFFRSSDSIACFIFLILLLLFVLFVIFYFFKCDYSLYTGVDVVKAPPGNLLPSEMFYLVNLDYKNLALTAELVEMARCGYLKIEENGGFLSNDYVLKNNLTTKDCKPIKSCKLHGQIHELLFEKHDSVTLSSTNRTLLQEVNQFLKDEIEYRYEDPWVINYKKFYYTGVFSVFTVCFVPMCWLLLDGRGGSSFAFILFYGFICKVFYNRLKRLTPQAQELYNQAQGFKKYLRSIDVNEKAVSASKKSLDQFSEDTLQLFESYLPYAIALGIAEDWGIQFKEIFDTFGIDNRRYSPHWHSSSSSYHRGFDSSEFSSSITTSFNSAIASSAGIPGSSSGFGGGSSGGGGGGGGGGGW